MGTLVEITISTGIPKIDVLNAIDEAFNQFNYVINKFSRFKSTSELSKLNRNAGTWHKVSADLFHLIEYSLELSKLTSGLFDPTIIDILRAYGYDSSYDTSRIARHLEQNISTQLEQQKTTRPSPLDIKLNKSTLEVRLLPDQNIDLGASAKGFAIDLAKNCLIRSGLNDFIINAGGDIWAQGTKKIALFSPTAPDKILGAVKIKNKSIAASGTFAKKVGAFHHLINPKTMKPHSLTLQAYAIAQSAMEADAWATALFLLGQEGVKLARQYNIKTIIISENGVYGDTNLIS